MVLSILESVHGGIAHCSEESNVDEQATFISAASFFPHQSFVIPHIEVGGIITVLVLGVIFVLLFVTTTSREEVVVEVVVELVNVLHIKICIL